MRVTYVARSFLDYRIPVFEALNEKLDNQFSVIYSADFIPDRVNKRAIQALGAHAIGMTGEKRIGPKETPAVANSALCVVYQPGLLKKIRMTRPDVVISDGFFLWTVFALLHRMFHKCGLVVCYERTFHTERNAQWFRTAYRRAVLRFVDAMACNGQLSSEYSKWLGIPESRITTGQMAADVDNLVQRSKEISKSRQEAVRRHWGNPDVMFLAVGKIIEEKGVKHLLEGWAQLERNMPGNWGLVFIGTGPDEERMKKFAKELGLKRTFFEGAIDYNELPQFYASADVFVMPTLEDNWSLVVPEAMACGLPVLCSSFNGCYPELIQEDVNGWVFDPLSAQDTFRVLKTAIEKQGALKDMGDRSRQIVASHRPEHAADAILKACEIAFQRHQ